MTEGNRIDLWLKHVCLFRTRSEAGNAVRGGHVKINGGRVKPSTSVRVEDTVEITRSDRIQKLEVLSVPRGQASRKDARVHYNDVTPQSERNEDRASEPRRMTRGKLSKKDRRDLRKLRGR